MLRPLVVAFCLPLVFAARAQNLVPNPSFEEYTVCPDNSGQVDRSVGWSAYRGSPDYFNACAPIEQGVPTNGLGHSHAATGSAYVGVLTWRESLPNGRELFGAGLSQELVPGVPVYVSFKMKPATGGFASNMRWSANGIGVRFSIAPYQQLGGTPLPNAAAVYTIAVPMDTSEWQIVGGYYLPDSGYANVVIGNFFSDSLVTTEVLNDTGGTDGAYVYIDDVCVSIDPDQCPDITGVLRTELPLFTIVPNPCRDFCTVRFHRVTASQTRLTLFDGYGRACHTTTIPSGVSSHQIQLIDFPDGFYYLRLDEADLVYPSATVVHVSF